MKRSEIGVMAVAAAFAAALIAAMLAWGVFFSNSIWTNGGSNLLGVVVGPSLAASIGVAAWTRWSIRCRATKPCIRRGEHPVAGTTKRVCEHHHTVRDHESVYAAYHVDGRLSWGESHNLYTATHASTSDRQSSTASPHDRDAGSVDRPQRTRARSA